MLDREIDEAEALQAAGEGTFVFRASAAHRMRVAWQAPASKINATSVSPKSPAAVLRALRGVVFTGSWPPISCSTWAARARQARCTSSRRSAPSAGIEAVIERRRRTPQERSVATPWLCQNVGDSHRGLAPTAKFLAPLRGGRLNAQHQNLRFGLLLVLAGAFDVALPTPSSLPGW